MIAHTAPKALAAGGVVIALVGLAFIFMTAKQELDAPLLLAPLLFAFGAFKDALAIDTSMHLRGNTERAQQLITTHGSPRGVKQWVIYKFAAMTTAWAATIFLVVHLATR